MTLSRYFNEPAASGVLTFGLRGGAAAIDRFVRRLKLAALVVHVGDARTAALHPASSTHAQLDDAQLRAAGISQDMVRVSVGIENPNDIIADFSQAISNEDQV
jgi:O-acetylhomoserine (thiol)-lyase